MAFTAFVTLVSADHDLNMQCVAKFRPVAIDTDDANGGIARTSFLYVEVEADQKITVEPMICPEGYVTPTKTYEIQYASSPDNYWSCPEPWSDDETITCDIPDQPSTYDDFLDNPASHSCVKVTHTYGGTGGGTRRQKCSAASTTTQLQKTSVAQQTNPPSTCANPHMTII